VALLLAVPLLFALALPLCWTWRLAWRYFRAARDRDTSEVSWPRAAVILSLRGTDPFLADCLRGVMEQDYPDYEVVIVVDSRDDPAWDAVEQFLKRYEQPRPPVSVQALEGHRDSCSLKVSAQLQALETLDDSVEAVALIDADVVPGAMWLRALVRPLLDKGVGAASGFRWYSPRSLTWGALVRYFWNAAACTQMYAFHIPWGGSLALHARVFRHPDLLNQWQESFGEDTRTYGVLRKLGEELRFVPAATMINTETIGLAGCCTFIRRQLFSARVSHSRWRSLLLANVIAGLALVSAVVILVVGALGGEGLACIAGGTSLGVYVLGMLAGLIAVEHYLRDVVRKQGMTVPTHSPSWKHLPAVLLTQLIYFGCLFSAVRLSRIDWRGVTYSLDRFGKLRLLEYRPYGPPATPSQQGVSVL
jgi:hypothetical protein